MSSETPGLRDAASPGDRIKVVVMIDSLRRPGGGERLAIEGALRLDPERYERWFCVTCWQDSFEREEPACTILATLRESGVEIVKLRRPPRSPNSSSAAPGTRRPRYRAAPWSWLPLLRLLRGRRVDVLHAHLFGSNVWASVLGPLARVPAVIAHEHMWAYREGGMRPFIDREVIARFADAFIAVSHEGRRRMIEIERIPEDSVVYIPNGVAQLPPGDAATVRSELGIPADAPLVGSVGHLRTEKAFEVLIEAIARLRERSPDAALLIAGEGPEREMLEGLRSRLGLDAAVYLPGARSDIPDVLAALDVAVCCSDFEGGPLSVMEYMGAGLPVVATRVGGLPELVQDGETGILVEPRDPAALAEAIGGLLADPSRRRELGSAGQDLRAREYDLDVWMSRIEALYASLLDARA